MLPGLDLKQPDQGYRFSLDPFLLAAFVRPRVGERILDLGAGVGVVALLLARRNPSVRVVALEIQTDLARYALMNTHANGLADRCFVVRGDICDAGAFFPAEHFHRIVSNPPYRTPGSGRISPHTARALARQESSFTLEVMVRTASSLLRFGGALDFIHLSERIPVIFQTLALNSLEPKKLRLVTPFPHGAPKLCLISARKGAKPGLDVLPSLTIHERPGRYSLEVDEALAPLVLKPCKPHPKSGHIQ